MNLELLGYAGLAFLWGMRHGVDADHLATIDGFVRRQPDPRRARLCGLWFSLGHGLVVMLVAALAAAFTGNHDLPPSLELLGASISIVFLLWLGGANLHQVLTTPPTQTIAPLGLRSRFFARTSSAPAFIIATGALFALSFDTLSQALLFSLAARGSGSIEAALLLSGVFMLGMISTDALNGAWATWLMRRADQRAAHASRVMGWVVALSSLSVALLGIARLNELPLPKQADGLWLSAGLLLALLGAYLLTTRLAARPT
ncbi:MAG: nickel transporter [Nitrosomonadales bacterium]|nr:nickel transporter [Nitrosomonadales bacterium]